MKHVPIEEQITCVKREIAMRNNVYPRRVASGKMKQIQADYEVQRMEAVLRTLEVVRRQMVGEEQGKHGASLVLGLVSQKKPRPPGANYTTET
jgi:hypothetical protein